MAAPLAGGNGTTREKKRPTETADATAEKNVPPPTDSSEGGVRAA